MLEDQQPFQKNAVTSTVFSFKSLPFSFDRYSDCVTSLYMGAISLFQVISTWTSYIPTQFLPSRVSSYPSLHKHLKEPISLKHRPCLHTWPKKELHSSISDKKKLKISKLNLGSENWVPAYNIQYIITTLKFQYLVFLWRNKSTDIWWKVTLTGELRCMF